MIYRKKKRQCPEDFEHSDVRTVLLSHVCLFTVSFPTPCEVSNLTDYMPHPNVPLPFRVHLHHSVYIPTLFLELLPGF